jgi:integrase
MTFDELSKWYLDLEKVKALSSHWRVKLALDRFCETFGNRIVSTILPSEIENYQAKRGGEGRSAATIDQEVGAAKSVINKAFENDMACGETLKRFKRVKKLLKAGSNKRDRVLTVEEADSLIESSSRHISVVVSTAYHTGMRRGEILNLTWDRIEMKEKLIRLRAKDTKNRRPRVVPISDTLYPILKAIPRSLNTDRVFLHKGNPFKDLRTGLQEACKKAKILYGRNVEDGFIFHDLRHTFNTDMRKAGIQQSVIMVIMGHEDPGMFHRYDTVDIEDMSQAMELLKAYRRSVRQNVRQNHEVND